MLGIRLGLYWRFTWGFFIPVALIVIFIYSLVTFETFREGDYLYPVSLTGESSPCSPIEFRPSGPL